MKNSTLIIAEAGVNHNGNIELAKKLIDAAVKAGVDYVKFQTFKAEKLVSSSAKQAEYQQRNIGKKGNTQFDMLKMLELDVDTHRILIDYCNQSGIKFLSTAFDLESIDLLVNLGIDLFKIPSGEITNLPYLEKIAKIGKPVILSTGMCTIGDVENAFNVFIQAGLPRHKISILHCNTEYPTPMKDVNLNAMNTLGAAFDVNYGYSDHTLGIEVPIAAVAKGATIVEKHFTLDKNMEGPDHKASLEPRELKDMVMAIRNIELALGSAVKMPSPSEHANMKVARKSIHCNKPLAAGDTIAFGDLTMIRPGNGISPMEIYSVLGKKMRRDLGKGEILNYTDFE
ncbi:N-acetylneuraminate synthase [Reichenbachiella carrageenanivorans]|uniref:N-acetylneuraminate synthase n=1 Tax=Reichenbachiella carrageenanivorans TaxID=2979869 RepID=A0ABY6D372_9BACT|nr:N-acetylneuraminate synthase [Reichenbachiella carrageenanivorans]UXX80605.1 N-acetylneuraminate synthase [Reichenbachiella carrageenanivorans]